jgi:hypothetical protein
MAVPQVDPGEGFDLEFAQRFALCLGEPPDLVLREPQVLQDRLRY